jgi:hypothetical protein
VAKPKSFLRNLALVTVYLFVITAIALQGGQQGDVKVRTNIASKVSEELRDYVVERAEPAYPTPAIAARAGGEVVVEVKIENGNVVSAKAISGHPCYTVPQSRPRRNGNSIRP